MADSPRGPRFWRGRRVLLTGHTGFKGTWLAVWLMELGADVTGMALAPDTTPSMFAATGLERRVDSRTLDIREPEAVRAVVTERQPRSCCTSPPRRWSGARTPIRSARTRPT